MTGTSAMAARTILLMAMGACVGLSFGIVCEHLWLWTGTGLAMGAVAAARAPGMGR